MQSVVTYFIAVAIGLMTSGSGVCSCAIRCLRKRSAVIGALVIGGVTSACAAVVQNRLNVFLWTFLVFAGTWICVLVVLARREIRADRSEPPIDGDHGAAACD